MAEYATAADLRQYASDLEVQVPGDDATVERLLQRSERLVDLALGPGYTRDPDTGLKLDVDALTEAQQTAVSRAACGAACWLLTVGLDLYTGSPEFIVSPLITARPEATSPPLVDVELAGSGLIRRSGTVYTPPAAA